MKNVEDNPNQMASMGIASVYANAHNIDKLTETLKQFKGKMAEMKVVLKKEEAIQGKIVDLEKAIAQEAWNPGL